MSLNKFTVVDYEMLRMFCNWRTIHAKLQYSSKQILRDIKEVRKCTNCLKIKLSRFNRCLLRRFQHEITFYAISQVLAILKEC
jgi:hypothetical protein